MRDNDRWQEVQEFARHAPGDELFTVAQAAGHVSSPMSVINDLVRSGVIRSRRVNGVPYILRSDLDRVADLIVEHVVRAAPMEATDEAACQPPT